MVHVAAAELPDVGAMAVVDVHVVAPALPATVHVMAPVGATPPVPVTVPVKTMLPPRAVTRLSVTTLLWGGTVAPATLAIPTEIPDATKAPIAKCRIRVRRIPTRNFLSPLI